MLQVGGDRSRRGVNYVDLARAPAWFIRDSPTAQEFVGGAIVSRHVEITQDWFLSSAWHSRLSCARI